MSLDDEKKRLRVDKMVDSEAANRLAVNSKKTDLILRLNRGGQKPPLSELKKQLNDIEENSTNK